MCQRAYHSFQTVLMLVKHCHNWRSVSTFLPGDDPTFFYLHLRLEISQTDETFLVKRIIIIPGSLNWELLPETAAPGFSLNSNSRRETLGVLKMLVIICIFLNMLTFA